MPFIIQTKRNETDKLQQAFRRLNVAGRVVQAPPHYKTFLIFWGKTGNGATPTL